MGPSYGKKPDKYQTNLLYYYSTTTFPGFLKEFQGFWAENRIPHPLNCIFPSGHHYKSETFQKTWFVYIIIVVVLVLVVAVVVLVLLLVVVLVVVVVIPNLRPN